MLVSAGVAITTECVRPYPRPRVGLRSEKHNRRLTGVQTILTGRAVRSRSSVRSVDRVSKSGVRGQNNTADFAPVTAMTYGLRAALSRVPVCRLNANGAGRPFGSNPRRLGRATTRPANSRSDGDYWHSLPQAVERDTRINEALAEAGYRVIRFSESEVYKEPDIVATQLQEVIYSSS